MEDQTVKIRTAAIDDAEELLKVYTPYVEKTAITFEYDVPSLEEFKRRIENTLKKYPYLVAEKDGEPPSSVFGSRRTVHTAYAPGRVTPGYPSN